MFKVYYLKPHIQLLIVYLTTGNVYNIHMTVEILTCVLALNNAMKQIIYWLLCLTNLFDLPNNGLLGGRLISVAPLVIYRSVS